MIFGWVANWRPAEISIYEAWAARRRSIRIAARRRSVGLKPLQ